MSLRSYIQSLVPSFTKGQVVKSLDTLVEDLTKNTLPAYRTATADFGSRALKSEFNVGFEKTFKARYEGSYSGNYLNGIYNTLLQIESNVAVVRRMLEAGAADDFVSSALTLQTSTLLQWVETATFVTQYARQLLILTLTSEVHAGGDTEFPGMVPAELRWLQSNREGFFGAVNTMTVKTAKLEKVLSELPTVVINAENVEHTTSLIGASKADPLKFGFLPPGPLTIIRWGRQWYAEIQVARFKAAEEERKMLEFRLLQLKQKAKGQPNASLEQQIEYQQGRLQKLNYKIAQMEADYG